MANGTFEMGSTFNPSRSQWASIRASVAEGQFRRPLSDPDRGFTIKDFHGKNRILTVPEIFQYSSNIGTAKVADLVGTEGHKEFLTRLGLLTKMQTELPEVAMPSQPREWKKSINSITISFGHGVSTTPLQTAVAGVALVNGGKLIEPTFLPRTREQADLVAKQ